MSELEKLENKYVHKLFRKPVKVNKKKPSVKNVPVYKLYGNTYWKGWIKYFHYSYDSSVKKPDTFYQNPYYFKQKTTLNQKQEKDLEGRSQFIPTQHHFWGKLLATGNFNILSNRINEDSTMADTIANLNTDLIKYVHKSDNANGAIKDLGAFHEGHCISVATLSPDPQKKPLFNPSTDYGMDHTWVICTEKKKEKEALMSYLISIKLKRQELLNDFQTEKKLPATASELMKPKPFNPKVKRGGPSADDGYMLLLQDWSECSVKCGGGISTQQWMCVPPKKKGLPCPGDTEITKRCNKQPCPSILGASLHLPKNDKTHVTLNPIYAALPFSKRPQSYVDCEIKENDVLYKTKQFDPTHKTEVKIPARLVMNTQTISVFQDDGFETAFAVFNLSDTALMMNPEDHCCFFLTNQNRELELCGFGHNCGTKQNPIWVNEWKRDISYFLQKCHDKLEETNFNKLLKNHLKHGSKGAPGGANGVPLDMGSSSISNEMIKSKRSIIKKQVNSNVEVEMEKKVGETQKVAMTAIRREINLEDLIAKEEVQKQKIRSEELSHQIKQEEKKKEVLRQALKKRAESYKSVRLVKETQIKMNDIKTETKRDIKFKRSILKKKIAEIRNKFKRKHRIQQQKIQKIRSEIANDIMNANRNGNQETCKKARKDPKQINDYCDDNEPTDYLKNQSCKETESFCFRCCEIEFGNMFIGKRDSCLSMCDEEDKKDMGDGDWIWTAE